MYSTQKSKGKREMSLCTFCLIWGVFFIVFLCVFSALWLILYRQSVCHKRPSIIFHFLWDKSQAACNILSPQSNVTWLWNMWTKEYFCIPSTTFLITIFVQFCDEICMPKCKQLWISNLDESAQLYMVLQSVFSWDHWYLYFAMLYNKMTLASPPSLSHTSRSCLN